MKWRISVLFFIWLILFAVLFLLLFPTDDIVLEQQSDDQFDTPTERTEESTVAQVKPNPPCASQSNQKQKNPQVPTEELVPIIKGASAPKIVINGKEELSDLQREIDRQIQTALENRLIKILVKINIAACKTCTRDDKRIILQIKMMKAFLDGKPKLAQKYSEELDKYLVKKGTWLGDTPTGENNSTGSDHQN